MFYLYRRSPFFRYAAGGGLALLTAWIAVKLLPPYCAPLAWLIVAAAFFVIARQCYNDLQDARAAAREDKRDGN